ncbi:hypothetical protein K2173_000419 [Erythroxylum novogranatense]|uniref:Uncharacterized protein n=1 Tax=Erythroxylum novogranatense TaxID=1862640 RepID=A0AAV8SWJ9_9ROSI|nr:hypothetical protein K2173_000419 [Erythroxylum novogranatense]
MKGIRSVIYQIVYVRMTQADPDFEAVRLQSGPLNPVWLEEPDLAVDHSALFEKAAMDHVYGCGILSAQ